MHKTTRCSSDAWHCACIDLKVCHYSTYRVLILTPVCVHSYHPNEWYEIQRASFLLAIDILQPWFDVADLNLCTGMPQLSSKPADYCQVLRAHVYLSPLNSATHAAPAASVGHSYSHSPVRAPHRCSSTLKCTEGPGLGTDFTLAFPYTILVHYGELNWAAHYGMPTDVVHVSVGLEDPVWLLDVFMRALCVDEEAHHTAGV